MVPWRRSWVGTQEWINSNPLMLADLKGKVVLIDFWTFTCVNCIRTLPYLKLWHSKYADDGPGNYRGTYPGVRPREGA